MTPRDAALDTVWRVALAKVGGHDAMDVVLNTITPPAELRGEQVVFRCPCCAGVGFISAYAHEHEHKHQGERDRCPLCDGMGGLTGWEQWV